MRQIWLFVGVFSVGLVLFMMLTGQFDFLDREDPFREERPRPQVDRNEFIYACPDEDRKRDRFILRGLLDEGGSAPLRIGKDSGFSLGTLKEARLRIPIYGNEGERETDHFFDLEADEVTYDRAGRVELRKNIVGQSTDGSRVETDRLEVRWNQKDRDTIRVLGSEPVRVVYLSSVELFSESGFSGSIDSSDGLERIEVEPPLVLAIDKQGGSSFLGLGGEEPNADSPERILLLSEGPLVLEQKPESEVATATFRGRVYAFVADASTPLHPRPQVPQEHIACGSLIVDLLPRESRVVRATAERGQYELSGSFLARSPSAGDDGTYRMVADRAVWEESTGIATFTGREGVRVTGAVGEFRAETARLETATRLVHLEEKVLAQVKPSLLDLSPRRRTDERAENTWTLSADQAELELAGSDSEEDLRFFRASSDEPNGVIVEEQIENGFRLTGSIVSYDADTQLIVVEPKTDAVQPTFSDGESHGTARTIRCDVAERTLELEGGVSGKVAGRALAGLSREDESKQSSRAELDFICGALTLAWDESRELESFVCTPESETLRVAYRHESQTLRTVGEQVSWNASDKLLKLEGEGRQSLFFETSLGEPRGKLFGGEVSFHTVELRGRAVGDVELEAEPELLGREPSDSSSDETTALACDECGVRLARRVVEGSETTVLEWAMATSQAPRRVVFDDGMVKATAGSVEWSEGDGTLELTGPGPQEVTYLTKEGARSASANRITVVRDEPRVRMVFEGESRFVLDQRPTPMARRSSTTEYGARSWSLETERLVAVFERTGNEQRLELREIEAAGDFRARDASEALSLRGQSARWTVIDQRLVISSPEEDAPRQTFTSRSEGRTSRVDAERIVVFRDRLDENRVWVHLTRVLEARLQLPPERAESVRQLSSSGEFTFETDELLLQVSDVPSASQVGDDTATASEPRIVEALAFGQVEFRGEGDKPAHALADQALYRWRDQSITLFGKPDAPPQIIMGAGKQTVGDPVQAKFVRPKGRAPYFEFKPSSLRDIDLRRMRDVLEQFGDESDRSR